MYKLSFVILKHSLQNHKEKFKDIFTGYAYSGNTCFFCFCRILISGLFLQDVVFTTLFYGLLHTYGKVMLVCN